MSETVIIGVSEETKDLQNLGAAMRCAEEFPWAKKVEDAARHIAKQEKRIKLLEARLAAIQAVVNEQAEDEGLWFKHEYITEWALQEALRRLHSVIEGEAQ